MAWVYLVLAIGLFPHMTVSCHENTSLCLIIEYLIAASVELVGTKLVTKDGLACKLMDFSSNRAAFQQTTLLTDSATDLTTPTSCMYAAVAAVVQSVQVHKYYYYSRVLVCTTSMVQHRHSRHVTARSSHSGSKRQKSAKTSIKKIVKLTCHTCVCNSFTNF